LTTVSCTWLVAASFWTTGELDPLAFEESEEESEPQADNPTDNAPMISSTAACLAAIHLDDNFDAVPSMALPPLG
jgi:hypothetical protein